MTQKGMGQQALTLSFVASAFGGLIASVFSIFSLPLLARVRPAPSGFDASRVATVRGGVVRVEPGAGTSEVPSAHTGDGPTAPQT